MATDGTMRAVIGADNSQYMKAMQDTATMASRTSGKINSSFDNASAGMDNATKKSGFLNSSIGKIAVGVGAVSLVSKGLNVLSSSIGGAVSRFDTLNAYPKVMKQMNFSTEDTNKSIGILKKGVDGLPTSLQDLTKSAQSFAILEKSATKGAQTATALNDAFLASGASASDASRGVEQYSQMLASGKVDLQSWKTLQETMPYALTKVANAFGITGKSAERDLYAKLQSGEITMDQLNEKFTELDGGASGFAATARTASGGIGTSFTNMKNAVTNNLANVLTEIDKVVKATSGKTIAQNLDGVKVVINAIGSSVVKSIGGIVPILEKAKSAFGKLYSTLKDNGSIASFSSSLNGIKAILNIVITSIKGFFSAITKGANSSNVISGIANAIQLLSGFLNSAVGKVKYFFEALNSSGYIDKLVQAFNSLKGIIGDVIKIVGNLFSSFVNSGPSAESAINGIVSVINLCWSATNKMLNAVKGILDFISQNSDIFTPLIIGIASGIAAFKAWNGAISIWKTGMAAFNSVTKIATAAQAAFNVVMDANLIMLIVTAIAALVAGLVYFFTQTKTGKKLWSDFMKFLGPAWIALVAIAKDVWKTITEVFTVVVSVIKSYWNSISSFYSGLWNGITSVAIGIWNKFGTSLTAIWNGIVNVAKGVFLLLKTAILTPIQLLIDLLTGNWTKLGSDLQTLWTNIVTGAQLIWNGLLSYFSGIFGIIATYFTTVWNTIAATAAAIWNGIVSAAQSIFNGLVSFMTGLWNGMINIAVSAWNGMLNGIVSIANAIKDGAVNAWNALVSGVTSLVTGLVSSAISAWNNLKSSVINIANGIKDGAINAWNALVSGVQSIIDSVVNIFDTLKNINLLDIGKAIIDGFVNGLTGAWKKGMKFISGIGDWIREHKGPIREDRKLLIPAGNAIMGGFGSSLNNAFDSVKSNVLTYADQLSGAMNNVSFNGAIQKVSDFQSRLQDNTLTAQTAIAGGNSSYSSEMSQDVLNSPSSAVTVEVYQEWDGDNVYSYVKNKDARSNTKVKLIKKK